MRVIIVKKVKLGSKKYNLLTKAVSQSLHKKRKIKL
jgi:hypothetical protein